MLREYVGLTGQSVRTLIDPAKKYIYCVSACFLVDPTQAWWFFNFSFTSRFVCVLYQ